MKFDITLADLAIVDTETGEEILDFGSLLIPDENSLPVDPFVEIPAKKVPDWWQKWLDDDEVVDIDEEFDEEF